MGLRRLNEGYGVELSGCGEPPNSFPVEGVLGTLFPRCGVSMETKNVKRYLVWIQKHLGVDGGVCVSPIGLANGLCMYWRKGMSVQFISRDSYSIGSYRLVVMSDIFRVCAY